MLLVSNDAFLMRTARQVLNVTKQKHTADLGSVPTYNIVENYVIWPGGAEKFSSSLLNHALLNF